MVEYTLQQAKDDGHNKLYFTYNGIGDNIALYFAAKVFFTKTKEKLLISIDKKTRVLFKYMDDANIIDGFSAVDFSADYDSKCQMLTEFGVEPIFINVNLFKELNDGTGANTMFWPNTHFLARYCERVGLSGEIVLCPQIELNDEEKKYGRFFQKNQIAIISTGLQKYKSWPVENLQLLVNKLKGKYNFVQLGQTSDPKIKGALDKRHTSSLREVASILYNSDLFVGGIGGLMHLARAVNCRSVITYSVGEPTYYNEYACNINVVPPESCLLCGQKLRDPQHEECRDNYSCIRNVRINDVINAIHEQMQKVEYKSPLEVHSVILHPDKANGMYDFHAMRRTVHIPDAEIISKKRGNVKKEMKNMLKRLRDKFLNPVSIKLNDIEWKLHEIENSLPAEEKLWGEISEDVKQKLKTRRDVIIDANGVRNLVLSILDIESNNIYWKNIPYLFKRQSSRLYFNFHAETRKLVEHCYNLLTPCDVVNGTKIRISGISDGGYVMLDPGEATKNRVAYSFGVSTNDPWSLEMAKRGFPVFQYDGTVDGSPDKHPLIKFNKKNISGAKNPEPNEMNIKQIINKLGHEKTDIILQCDIENAEWDFFGSLTEDEMNQFEQIIIELHDTIRYEERLQILKKINLTHQSIHVHGNNHSGWVLDDLSMMPAALEVCYVRRTNPHNKQPDYEFTICNEEFPTKLDYPCDTSVPDIYLGFLGTSNRSGS